MSKKTGPVNTPQGKSDDNDFVLATNAVTQCVSSDRLELSKNYPFIILLILFYFTVAHSHNLIMKTENTPCNGYIKKNNYDDFISSFVYWIIAFILIIIIKYNGLNLINNFVINSDFYTNIGFKDDGQEAIKRGISIVDYLISGLTSIMNIYFVIILLFTLYKIIKNLIKLIQCNSKICTKSIICRHPDIDLSKVRYWDNHKCLEKTTDSTPPLLPTKPSASASLTLDHAPVGTNVPDSLEEDLYPYSIREIIDFWTFNTNLLGKAVLWIYIFLCVWAMGFYIKKGFKDVNIYDKALLFSPFYLFMGINLLYLLNGLWGGSDSVGDEIGKSKFGHGIAKGTSWVGKEVEKL